MQIVDSPQTISTRAEALYQRDLRVRLETPDNIGKFLVIDVETEQYEIDRDCALASQRLHARIPQALGYIVRIGSPTAFQVRGHHVERGEP